MHDIVPPTTVTCPNWCTESAGHGYDSEDHGILVRNRAAGILNATWTVHGTRRHVGVDVSTHEKSLSDVGPVVELGAASVRGRCRRRHHRSPGP